MHAIKVPFLDLVRQHQELKSELMKVVEEAFATAQFIGGPEVEAFEAEYAAFCGSRHCVAVSNGTDAVRFSLMAAGVEPGDTVVTTPFTFIATTEAISQAGADIEFVDIDEQTYNLDVAKLKDHLETSCDWDGVQLTSRRTGSRVRAIVAVHLYGQVADIGPILELGRRYNLLVIEDAAQAQGAAYRLEPTRLWLRSGSMGHVAAFSFYPGKNLGACGEAGAVTTNDPEIDHQVRMLRDHGQASKYYHAFEGYNGRLDAIQAGFLRIKLRHLEGWNTARRGIAERYAQRLAGADSLTVPFEPEWSRGVYHQYVVRHARRDELASHLQRQGVPTGLHYPLALHQQEAYRNLGYREGAFPIAELAASQVLSLPIDPGLSEEQVDRVSEAVLSFETAIA